MNYEVDEITGVAAVQSLVQRGVKEVVPEVTCVIGVSPMGGTTLGYPVVGEVGDLREGQDQGSFPLHY